MTHEEIFNKLLEILDLNVDELHFGTIDTYIYDRNFINLNIYEIPAEQYCILSQSKKENCTFEELSIANYSNPCWVSILRTYDSTVWLMEFIMQIEEYFNITIHDDQTAKLQNINELINLIYEKTN